MAWHGMASSSKGVERGLGLFRGGGLVVARLGNKRGAGLRVGRAGRLAGWLGLTWLLECSAFWLRCVAVLLCSALPWSWEWRRGGWWLGIGAGGWSWALARPDGGGPDTETTTPLCCFCVALLSIFFLLLFDLLLITTGCVRPNLPGYYYGCGFFCTFAWHVLTWAGGRWA